MSTRRDRNPDQIIPVTITAEAAQQEDRRGRKSTSSVRPGIPKRTSSMKRAYNYFFGAAAPVPASAAPPVTTTEATPPSKEDVRPYDNGVDTPPETPREAPRRLSEDEAGTSSSHAPPCPHLPNNAFCSCSSLPTHPTFQSLPTKHTTSKQHTDLWLSPISRLPLSPLSRCFRQP